MNHRTKGDLYERRWSGVTDEQLRASYRSACNRVVKTGKYKGCVTVSALRDIDKYVEEAARRGAEYPHNWLSV